MAFAIILEDGTGVAAANSYASVTEANLFHAANLYATEWTAAASTAGKQETALAMATRVIDKNCNFRGWRKSTTQGLEWPRIRAKNDDFYGQMPGRISALFANYFDDSSIPKYLKDATAQVALDLLRADRTLEASQKGISSLRIGQGAVDITFGSRNDRPMPLSEEAQRMLAKLVKNFRYGLGQVSVRRGQ